MTKQVTFSGEEAVSVRAFTVVSLVISFLRRSTNIGKHTCMLQKNAIEWTGPQQTQERPN